MTDNVKHPAHYADTVPGIVRKLCEVTELIIDAVNIEGAHHK